MFSSTAPDERPCISACIIAFNEADRLRDCLLSLAFCDEIVVVDSDSTDATAAVALECALQHTCAMFEGNGCGGIGGV